ncbi:hypothetical protein BJ546DRAFT_1059326 [Cryomyces antarcticus]
MGALCNSSIAVLPAIRITAFRSSTRSFSTSSPWRAKNRVYNSVRTEDEFTNLLLLSASSRKPLITLWTARWCASCKEVAPIIKELVEADGIGESEGGIGYAEVELDAPTIGDLPMRYMITSMPTLLAFDRQEAQIDTKVINVESLKDRKFLIEWLEKEAKRRGSGGAGGVSVGSISSGLFGR